MLHPQCGELPAAFVAKVCQKIVMFAAGKIRATVYLSAEFANSAFLCSLAGSSRLAAATLTPPISINIGDMKTVVPTNYDTKEKRSREYFEH